MVRYTAILVLVQGYQWFWPCSHSHSHMLLWVGNEWWPSSPEQGPAGDPPPILLMPRSRFLEWPWVRAQGYAFFIMYSSAKKRLGPFILQRCFGESKAWRQGGAVTKVTKSKHEPRFSNSKLSHQRAITFQKWSTKDREELIPVVSYHRLWFQLWWETWTITKLIHVGWGSSICKTWLHTQFVSAYAHLHGIEFSRGREQSGNWWLTGSWVNNNNIISSCPPWGAAVCQTLCVSAGSP